MSFQALSLFGFLLVFSDDTLHMHFVAIFQDFAYDGWLWIGDMEMVMRNKSRVFFLSFP